MSKTVQEAQEELARWLDEYGKDLMRLLRIWFNAKKEKGKKK